MPVMLCRPAATVPWGFTIAEATVTTSSVARAVVTGIEAGSEADRVGIRVGDVVAWAGESRVATFGRLRTLIGGSLRVRLMIDRALTEAGGGSVRRLRLPLPPLEVVADLGPACRRAESPSANDDAAAEDRDDDVDGGGRAASAAAEAEPAVAATPRVQRATRGSVRASPPSRVAAAESSARRAESPSCSDGDRHHDAEDDGKSPVAVRSAQLSVEDADCDAATHAAPQQHQTQHLGWLHAVMAASCTRPSNMSEAGDGAADGAVGAQPLAAPSPPLRARSPNTIEATRQALQAALRS